MGLMIGVELVKNQRTRAPASGDTHEIVSRSFKKGLLLLPCGKNVIRFSPPLVISSEEVDIAVDIFSDVISQHQKKREVI